MGVNKTKYIDLDIFKYYDCKLKDWVRKQVDTVDNETIIVITEDEYQNLLTYGNIDNDAFYFTYEPEDDIRWLFGDKFPIQFKKFTQKKFSYTFPIQF